MQKDCREQSLTGAHPTRVQIVRPVPQMEVQNVAECKMHKSDPICHMCPFVVGYEIAKYSNKKKPVTFVTGLLLFDAWQCPTKIRAILASHPAGALKRVQIVDPDDLSHGVHL